GFHSEAYGIECGHGITPSNDPEVKACASSAGNRCCKLRQDNASRLTKSWCASQWPSIVTILRAIGHRGQLAHLEGVRLWRPWRLPISPFAGTKSRTRAWRSHFGSNPDYSDR